MNEDRPFNQQPSQHTEFPSSAPLPEGEEWCLGLLLVEHRSFTAQEAQEFQNEEKRLRRNGCLMGCGSPLVFFVPLMGAVGLSEWLKSYPILENATTILILALFLPVALLFLKAIDFLKQAKGLKQDLQAGYSKKFSGTVNLFEVFSEGQEAALKLLKTAAGYHSSKTRGAYSPDADRLDADRTVNLSMDVLPCSKRLWNINGVRTAKWTVVDWSAVAPPPPSAATAAAWVEPLNVDWKKDELASPLTEQQLGNRELSPSERIELQRRIRQLWLRPFWPTLFLTAWLGIPLTLHLTTGAPVKPEPTAYFLFFMCLYSWYSLIVALVNATKLRQDVRNGFVSIFRVPLAEEPDAAPTVEVAQPVEQPVDGTIRAKTVAVEILPISGWAWTEDGKPCEWRKIPGQQ
jgi:hypothetical protein